MALGVDAKHHKAVINHQKRLMLGLQHQPLILRSIKKAGGI